MGHCHFLKSTGDTAWGPPSRAPKDRRLQIDLVHITDKQQGYLLKSTGEMGLRIVSDMQQDYSSLPTGELGIFLATVTYDRFFFVCFFLQFLQVLPPPPPPFRPPGRLKKIFVPMDRPTFFFVSYFGRICTLACLFHFIQR